MKDHLREIVDYFVKSMEGVNERRVDAAAKELSYCMMESRLFNELRQNLMMLDNNHLQEVIDGIPKDQLTVEAPGVVLQRGGKKGKVEARS